MTVPHPGPERRRGRWYCGALLAGCLFASTGSAQYADTLHYTQQPVCRIPFQIDPSERRVHQVQLFVSTDLGKTWKQHSSAPPSQGHFQFTGEHDGTYWFAVRTMEIDGRAYPQSLDQLRPGLRVCIDTQPPVVTLRPLPPRDGSIGVEWDMRDPNLSLTGMKLEYRLPNSAEWQPLPVEPVAAGQKYWNPGTNGLVEVRARASDLARNSAEAKATVTLGNTSAEASVRPTHANADPMIHLVNSKRISLNFQIKDEGPSGISAVEMWYTQDGRSWQKYHDLPEKRPPFVFDVTDEGVYGFTLLARSGVGLGERPPQAGDTPQVWVEVDLKKPDVRVLSAEVSRNPEVRTLTVTWSAADKNLGRHPVTLKYAEQAEGNWVPIASNVENNGRYVWQIPPDGVPWRFFLKVEAADRAGNVGSNVWKDPVIVDLSKPRVEIITIEPANNSIRP